MNAAVDKFVIVESTETFRGLPKPLNFLRNKDRFAPFLDKIIYIIVDEHLETENPWERETYQRNQILRGLTECDKEDVILISDVDEIVEAKGVVTIHSLLRNRRQKKQYLGVSQRFHCDFLNSIPPSTPWKGTVATSYANLKKKSPQKLRDMRNKVPSVAFGWHFSWQGGAQQKLYKLTSFSHTECDTPEKRNSLLYENHEPYPVMTIDDSFPQYIVDNQAYFEEIGFILRPAPPYSL